MRWVVEQLKAEGTTFIGMPNGFTSYYFWSELPPPTPLNATAWAHLLTEHQQRSIISALEKHTSVCALVHQPG